MKLSEVKLSKEEMDRLTAMPLYGLPDTDVKNMLIRVNGVIRDGDTLKPIKAKLEEALNVQTSK